MKIHDLPNGSPCPVCGDANDACSGTGEAPRGGDLTLCGKCGELMAFNDDLSAREATLEDLMQLSDEQRELLDTLQKRIRKERILG